MNRTYPDFTKDVPAGVIPDGRYSGGERAGIVWVHLCAYCAGFAPITEPDYEGGLSGRCEGCENHSRELHRFRAFIDSVSGCSCRGGHPQAVGDVEAFSEAAKAD